MSPERRSAQNRPTRLSKELADYVSQRAQKEYAQRNPNGEYGSDALFIFEEGMIPRKAVEMRWLLEYLRETGRLRNKPQI